MYAITLVDGNNFPNNVTPKVKNKETKMAKRNNRGFTLIELLVVC